MGTLRSTSVPPQCDSPNNYPQSMVEKKGKTVHPVNSSFTIMNRVMRKPVFVVSDQVQHKPGCSATEDGKRLEISHLGTWMNRSNSVAETKALISFAVTASLVSHMQQVAQRATMLT